MKKLLLALCGTIALVTFTAFADPVVTTNASGGTTTTVNPVTDPLMTLPVVNTTDLNAVVATGKVIEQYLAANTNAVKATDWTFFGSYSKATGSITKQGFSLGAVYYINQYVGTQVRLQYLDTGHGGGLNAVLLPNGAITLSSTYTPIHALPWFVIRPLAETGAAVDLKGNAYGILGVGSEVDFYSTTNTTKVLQRISGFYGVEKWAGQNNFTLTQIGGAANFNLEVVIAKITSWF